jgi:hypothetical protein
MLSIASSIRPHDICTLHGASVQRHHSEQGEEPVNQDLSWSFSHFVEELMMTGATAHLL